MKQVIRQVRVLDPKSGRDEVSDVLIQEGKVAAIGAVDQRDATIIDGQGLWLMPGLVDLGCWLREPGLDHKATLASETYAAAASGITTLCYQPEPGVSVDNSAQVNLIHDIARDLGYANVRVIGNLTQKLEGQQLANMGGLSKSGCVAVSNGWQPFDGLNTLRKSMEYAATHGMTIFMFALEHSLANEGCVHEGAVSTRLGLPAIPAAAETVAVAQALALMEVTGTQVHFCRLSCAGSVRLIRQAKQAGLPVTADVAVHQLYLTEHDTVDYNPLCHVMPPLRSEADRDALLEGLSDNTIDAICSDHQPHELDAKMAPFQQTEPGISGLESLLPLSLRLAEEGKLDLLGVLGKITAQPARIIGNKAAGIEVEAAADLVLFNPDTFGEFALEALRSQGKNSPFAGWGFQGSVVQTLLAGKTVFSVNND